MNSVLCDTLILHILIEGLSVSSYRLSPEQAEFILQTALMDAATFQSKTIMIDEEGPMCARLIWLAGKCYEELNICARKPLSEKFFEDMARKLWRRLYG